MTATTEIILFIVGIGGGFISAVAGGSNVITFPTLQWAGIQSTIVATATTTLALTPGNPVAAWKDWGRRPEFDSPLIALLICTAISSVAGAQLLLFTPEWLFRLLVPLLLGGATLLFAFSKEASLFLARAMQRMAALLSREISPSLVRVLLYIPIAIYGGFFGAGLGILTLAVLSLGAEDERSATVTKNILNTVATTAAAIFYVWQGAVAWAQALWMLPGVAIGGFLGGLYAQAVSKEKLRATVIVIGTIVSLAYAWRFWI